jgi:hypothetical protein
MVRCELGSVAQQLCEDVLREWRRMDNDLAAFSAAAAEALRSAELPGQLTVRSLLGQALAPTHDFRVGAPHDARGIIPILRHPEMTICAHVWVDSTARPHSHSWSGAFQILDGEAVEWTSTFRPETAHDDLVTLGHLFEPGELRSIRSGDVCPVEAGFGTVHGLVHVTRPTLSVSVRREGIGRALQPHDHFGRLAIRSVFWDEEADVKLKCLHVVHECYPAEYPAAVRTAVEHLTPAAAWWLLMRAPDVSQNPVIQQLLQSWAWSDPMRDAVHQAWQSVVVERQFVYARSQCEDVNARRFLAYLQLAPNRDALLRAIGLAHAGADPQVILGTWIRDYGHLIPREGGHARVHALLKDHSPITAGRVGW